MGGTAFPVDRHLNLASPAARSLNDSMKRAESACETSFVDLAIFCQHDGMAFYNRSDPQATLGTYNNYSVIEKHTNEFIGVNIL